MGSIWATNPNTVTREGVFVDPESGDTHPFWLALRKRLNVGEERDILTAGWKGMTAGPTEPGGTAQININWSAQGFARAAAYIKDWSLTDDDGKKLSCDIDTIRSLRSEVFEVVERVLNAHVEAVQGERKTPAGETAPSGISA